MDDEIALVIETLKKCVPEHPYKSKEPFKVLIATIISQRTKDEVTYYVADKLFRKYPSPYSIMNATTETIAQLIYPSGFYRQKAIKIKEVAEIIHNRYHDTVPDTIDALLALPGVGRKTANIVLSRCFEKDVIAVDTHVHRISNRLGWVKTKTPEETENALMRILPKKYWRSINELLVMFGRTICRPVNPKCEKCPVKEFCKYYKQKKKEKVGPS